ncbi:MAG: PGPGW domain-containing protein [Thermoguttaceae bacterium]|jgi:hypothetical protein|nr:PGPGW domain-containing protein [Thermoguttaceae bacterium]
MIQGLPLGRIVEWTKANEAILLWLAGTSTFVFVATLIAVPWLAARIPHDYFAHQKRRPAPWANQHPALRGVLIAGKNLLGAVFVVVGLAMLVLPGQGLLTILAGIVLLDFPGKYRLEYWVVSRRPVLRSINWLRRRAGRPPLIVKRKWRGKRRGKGES